MRTFSFGILQFAVDQFHADAACILTRVIDKKFFKRHQCVRMAAIEDLTGLAQTHEAVARASLTIACCAEGRNISHLHQPPDDFVERTLVGNIELLGVVRTLLLGVAADRGAGRTADLEKCRDAVRARAHLLLSRVEMIMPV